jgi:hypothetical protein
VSRDQFNNVVISVKRNLIEIAKSIALEIREQFTRDELLEAMYVVYPQYWNPENNREAKRVDFLTKLKILVHQFGKNCNVQEKRLKVY